MPPMDKSDRYIVHDLVACEFPELLSDNVGEESDRYAIIYKKVQSIVKIAINICLN